MALFINKIILAGNLTSDPELMQTTAGVPVLRFRLAVNRKYQKEGEGDGVDFHSCVAWRGKAEFLGKYARKGDLVYVEGELQNRAYTDKQGQKKYITEIIADDVKLMSKLKSDEAPTDRTFIPGTTAVAPPNFEDAQDDDLPF